MASRSNSSTPASTAEATSSTTKSVSSGFNALNGQMSGLYDNGVRHEFSAVQETFETTRPVSSSLALVCSRLGLWGWGQGRG